MQVLRVVGITVLSLLVFGGACSDDGGRPNPDTTGTDGAVADGPAADGVEPDGPSDAGQVDEGPTDGPADTTPPSDTCPSDLGGVPGTWVTIPPNGAPPMTFLMGSPASEPCRGSNEDLHQVTFSRRFEIQATEVTQGQFQALMGYNPADFAACGCSCPVEMVYWHEAAAYCNALSANAGLAQCYSCTGTGASVSCSEATAYSGQKVYDCPGYRLPTEAEWEYAYRAGTTTAYYNGANDPATCSTCSSKDANADKIGWYRANSGVGYSGCYDFRVSGCSSCAGPHPVGQKQPNAWGLYDMAGNVWEWCHDWYQANLGSAAVTDPWGSGPGPGGRVVSGGGSWYNTADDMRAARRGGYAPGNRGFIFGFRCARSMTP
jgi:formylglycine-generating enzyme required for sulfatase activity